MGTCACSQNKFQNIKLDNVILDELEKQKSKEDNSYSFKTKNTTSPTGITKFKYEQKNKFNLNIKHSSEEKRAISINKLNKLQSQKLIYNRSLYLNGENIKKNFEKTILIYGEKETGKTSFVMKICKHKFENFYIPSFNDERTEKMLRLKPYSKRFKLEFIVSNNIDIIKNADCYFIFYDVTCLHSLNFAKNLIENKILSQKKPIFLIGNKIDLKINVEYDLLDNYVSLYNLKLFNISIKESNGISSLLEKLGEVLDYKDEVEVMNN